MTELRIDDTELLTWFERDRAHVELRNRLDDSTIVEWWDEDLSEAVEDGLLNPRDYHSSATTTGKSAVCCPMWRKHETCYWLSSRERSDAIQRWDGHGRAAGADYRVGCTSRV